MKQHRMQSPAILVAAAALVAALAGTAVAGPDATTSAISKKKVKKIAAKQINKLAPGLSVASAETATTAENATKAQNANTVGGIPPSEIGGKGRSSAGGSGCNDDDGNGQDCTSVELNLGRTQRVLVAANGEWSVPSFDDPGTSDSTDLVRGTCRVFLAPGGALITDADMGEARVSAGAAPVHGFVSTAGSYSMTGVTGALDSGTYTFTVNCIETDGDIDFHRARLSVVTLGSG